MTALKITPMNTPSSSTRKLLYESPMKSKQASSSSFLNDLSNAKQWSDIESTLSAASVRYDADNDNEIGWIEGRVHETRSTQKEVEILLVHPPESRCAYETRRDAPEALRIFITCAEFARFVFAINQHIKVSLKGARIIHELVPHGSSMLPFSLVFSSTLAIQSVRGGVCMPDGVVVDARENRDYCGNCYCLESAVSKLSMMEDAMSSPSKKAPTLAQNEPFQVESPDVTLVDSTAGDVFDEFTAFPALNTLIEGMMTPLLGIVETVKPPSTTTSGELCVSLTLADASSYESKRGFRLTCFTTRTRLARELPNPSEGDVILLKSVKVNKWAGGTIGTVYHNNLDWISYNPTSDTISVPKHAKSEPTDSFYENAEKRKKLFRQFVAAVESGPWMNNTRGA